MSTKGQIVIPKRLREELGLQPGDPLAMAVDGERLILRKITLDDLLQESTKNYSEGKTLSHEETFKDLV
jgi:AbrB family looped-hinge helix DNA binding protein